MIATVTLVSCGQKNPEQVTALIDRIGGEGTSERIETQVKRSLSKDGKDVFEISSKDGKPYILGSSMSPHYWYRMVLEPLCTRKLGMEQPHHRPL